MKFSALIAPTTLSLLVSRAHAVSLSFDEAYSAPTGSLKNVACSDGSHGLIPRGFTTFGSLPNFPHIGGIDAILGWNSINCGTCYQLIYTNTTSGIKRNITMLAIDSTSRGYNIALPAMNELTGGQAAQLGRIEVTAKQVSASACGLH